MEKGQVLGASQFSSAAFDRAEIEDFRRIIIDGELRQGNQKWSFQCIVKLDAHLVRVVTDEGCPRGAEDLAAWIIRELERHSADPDRGRAVRTNRRGAMVEFAVMDARWFAAVLHDRREFGPIAISPDVLELSHNYPAPLSPDRKVGLGRAKRI